jgi:hypothetical protein
MHVKDHVHAALQCKRTFATIMQGGNDAVATLAYAKACTALYGWPELIGKAALAQSRELIMPSMMAKRDALGAAVYKASVGAGTTTDPNFAGPLVAYAMYSTGWLASLINQSLFENVVALAKPLPINSRFGVTTGIGTAGTPAESGWSPITKFEFGGEITVPQHVDVITVLSNDLLKFKAPFAEELLNTELQHAITLASDAVAAAILLNGISLMASTNNARQDLAAAFGAIDLAQGSKPLIFTSPAVVKQLALMGQTEGAPCFPDVVIPGGGSISGVPLLGCDVLSNYSTDGDLLIVVDAAQCAGDSGVVVADAATSGTLQMLDSSLGSPSEGAELVSLFQTDSTALKLQRWFSLVRVRSTAVAAIKHCAYGVGSPS